MICQKCGSEAKEGAKFCHSCGEALKQPITEQEVEKSQSSVAEKASVKNQSSTYEDESSYYQERFRKFDENEGKKKASLNWAAFFFGVIWYLYKGMWGKAILIVLAGIFIINTTSSPFSIFVATAFYPLQMGNWDYYLLKKKGTQWW